MTPQTRAELNLKLAQLADGERSAFDYVFETTWPLVHGLAKRTLGPSHDADDVGQQALMKVFARAHEFNKERDALSWILGITSYECMTLRQRVRRRKEDLSDEQQLGEIRDSELNPEDQHIKKDLHRALRDVLTGMSLQDQETILASIDDEVKSSVTGATYRKRLQRALQRLRDEWRSRHG